MEISAFLTRLLATDNPVLPSHAAMLVAQYLGWALVLGCATLLLTARLARPYRLGLCAGVMLWALVPGSASPTYWLALSFQTPSLMSSVLGLSLFWTLVRSPSARQQPILDMNNRGVRIGVAMGIGLGGVLLLDTLAYLPQPVYGWGFSTAVLGVFALLMTLLWGGRTEVKAGQAHGRSFKLNTGALLGLVLLLFVVTRLPTGNLWDALIDPWLWIALQVGWLASVLRLRQARQRL